MLTIHRRVGNLHSARIRISERSDGDARSDSFLVGEREDLTLPHQIHGSKILVITEPGEGHGIECDGLITSTPGAVIGVRSADCVPVALYSGTSSNPLIGVVHAGWRGIRAGVIDEAVKNLVELGSGPLRAIIGPHISAEEYEFGISDLATMVTITDENVVGQTKDGSPALDLGAAVEAMLLKRSVVIDYRVRRCTAKDPRYWSHRGNRDIERFALLAEIGSLS